MLTAGLVFAIFLEYVNPDSFVPVIGALKIGTIVPLFLLVLALAQTEPVTNGRMFSHVNTKLILFFLFLLTFSVLISDVTMYSFKIFKNALANVFWFMMIVKLASDYDKIKKVFAALIWSHIIILVLNPSVILEPESRSYLQAAPFLGDGNDFALSVCVVWPMCLILAKDAESKIKKIVYYGALVVLVLSIIGTQSRGASLALAASLLFLWLNSSRKLVHVVVIAIAVVGVFAFAPAEYFGRMGTLANYEQEESAQGRIMAWKSGVRMAVKYPLTGVGSGHYPVALGTEFRPYEWGDQNLPWATAHSMYFLVLGELGLPGIICLLLILIGNFRRLNRLKVEARGSPLETSDEYYTLFLMLSASLVGFCIGGAFLSVAYYPHIFVLSALAVAATFAYERDIAVAKIGGGGSQ